MDCTYKTNRYKMPLLDIIGISSFNTSFYSGFAFLEKEREEDYLWALNMFKEIVGSSCQPSVIVTDRELALMNAIRIAFPTSINLLCIWHIEKNILTNCKRYFEVEDDWKSFLSFWNTVVYSSNEITYEENWKEFILLYKEKKDALSYIQQTWIPLGKHFISAWTEKYLHFGNRASSRAEAAHAKLKRYLQVSTGDFCQVKDKLCLAIENEFQEIKAQLSSERIRIPHDCNSPFFKEVVTRVSMFALRELFKQYEIMKHGKMQLVCTGNFTATMGLPCAHKMMNWKDKVIPLDAIHSQWRIDTKSLCCMVEDINKKDLFEGILDEFQERYQQWPLVKKQYARETLSQLVSETSFSYLEPKIHSHKGRPLGSKKTIGSSSTKRDPSGFEQIENVRKCSICKDSGHNSRTCKNRNDGSTGTSAKGIVDIVDRNPSFPQNDFQ